MTIENSIKDYYGNTLKTTNDLKTTACCTLDSVPKYLKPLIKNVHSDVLSKFYGCGSPLPLAIKGKTILDLGCGSGRDCYLASQLVGNNGRVIGVDMTDNQLKVAKEHLDYHSDKFGYANVEFHKSFIEDLSFLKDNSVDVVISNCVLNLSANKEATFKEIFRVLKKGGELYFSDVFADRRIPKKLLEDPILVGECLSGALYLEDFRRMIAKIGCADYRVISSSTIDLEDEDISDKIGFVSFNSVTIRAFKIELEDTCEDYGQVAYYTGGIDNAVHSFELDNNHTFKKNMPVLVCSNTAKMLEESRLSKYFKIIGNTDTHYGIFDCSTIVNTNNSTSDCC